jgi:N-acetylglucosaminyldiphosphoundecaprenol N-acetyl-beta-D-mannosaminyltransferase
MKLQSLNIVCSKEELANIPDGKTLINTINAHSYNIAQKEVAFAEALNKGDYLIPDGASIVMACRWLKAKSQPKERIAGWDLFSFEMNALERKSEKLKVVNDKCLKVMFMGSSEKVLSLIRKQADIDYPNLEVVTYSPPYKPEFSEEDSQKMIQAINDANPDLLWIGMTAPKQEKWTYKHWNELNIHCHCGTIGAVFDFYAGTVKRAPLWWQQHSLEWFYRLLMEPRRMWRRYIIGNAKFLYYVYKEL